MSKLERKIIQMKTASHGPAVEAYCANLIADISKKVQRIRIKVKDQLDAPRPNEAKVQADDVFAMRQALDRIQFEPQIRALFDFFGQSWQPYRERYYRGLWAEIGPAFKASAPSWVSLEIKHTEKEFDTLTNMVHGLKMNDHIKWLRDKTIFRLRSIVASSYQPVAKRRKEYRQNYQDALAGAMDNLLRQFQGLLRGIFEVTYEQFQSRFLGVING